MSEHHRKLENTYANAPINRYFEPRLKIEEGRAELRMTIRPDWHHAAGAVHGSVYFKALDDAAFFAANSVVEGHFILTASFHIDLMRPVVAGELIAVGRLVEQSRRRLIADATLEDDNGRLLARGTGSFMPSSFELTPEIGYR